MSDDNDMKRAASGGSAEIHRNDPRQERIVRRWVTGAIVALVVIWLLIRYWRSHANAYDLLHHMYTLCYLAGLGLLVVAWYSYRYAKRIFESGRYPPPGGWVLGDTRVLRGAEATARGRQVVVCAVALVLLGLYALYLPHSINAMFPVKEVRMDMEPEPSKADAPAPAAPPAKPAPAAAHPSPPVAPPPASKPHG